MQIRPFEPRDRASVREICCDTADRGEPVERFFSDRDLFADLLTRYYTDIRPEAVWVAEKDGRVVGYLTGALDTCHYRRTMVRRILPQSILKAIRRGLLFRRQTWRLAQTALRTWHLGGFRREVPLAEYPAHFHINVRSEFRGAQIGQHLWTAFYEQAKSAGLTGIHLTTREDNPVACRFFEKIGFHVLSRHSLVPAGGGGPTRTVTYGKRL